MKVTPAEVRALKAVERKEVRRRYSATGNTLKGPTGVGSVTLWSLHHKGLIDDEKCNRPHEARRRCVGEFGG